MKGYKAFSKGLVCAPDKTKPFQFAENTVFETDEAEICESGFHFCAEPLDVLDYYPLIDDDGNMTEFAEVEALDEPKTDDGEKFCTKKIKIGAKIAFADFIKACFSLTCESVKKEAEEMKKDAESGGDDAKLVGGDDAQLVGGYAAKLVGGDDAQLVGSYAAKLVGGDAAQLVGGDAAQLVGGDDAQLVGGYAAKLVGGDDAQLVGGDAAKLVGGKHSIVVGDNGSLVKGKKGALLVLVERKWEGNEYIIKNYKAELVDGKKIKEDTFYRLVNGEFREVSR